MRVKNHCYFLGQTWCFTDGEQEKNFEIFLNSFNPIFSKDIDHKMRLWKRKKMIRESFWLALDFHRTWIDTATLFLLYTQDGVIHHLSKTCEFGIFKLDGGFEREIKQNVKRGIRIRKLPRIWLVEILSEPGIHTSRLNVLKYPK